MLMTLNFAKAHTINKMPGCQLNFAKVHAIGRNTWVSIKLCQSLSNKKWGM